MRNPTWCEVCGEPLDRHSDNMPCAPDAFDGKSMSDRIAEATLAAEKRGYLRGLTEAEEIAMEGVGETDNGACGCEWCDGHREARAKIAERRRVAE